MECDLEEEGKKFTEALKSVKERTKEIEDEKASPFLGGRDTIRTRGSFIPSKYTRQDT